MAALLTPFNPSLFTSASTACLVDAYYGTYASHALFLPEPDCLATAADVLASGTLVPLPWEGASLEQEETQLLWVEEAAIDDSARGEETLSFGAELDAFLATHASGGSQQPAATDNAQVRLGATPAPVTQLLHRTERGALLSLAPSLARDLTLAPPRLWTLRPVPATPTAYLPVPDKSIDPVRKVLKHLKHDPVVASLVERLSVSQMRADVRYLTGEQDGSPILSRHSFSEGSRVAANWIKGVFEGTGATCELKDFLVGFAPNVVCRYPATTPTNETVLLSAHYDSRGSFGSTRAPGGDDDGSGTTALLSIARAIYASGVTFKRNVELVTFAGEEQGLYGSRAYARELRGKDAQLVVMIQADMLAYHVKGERAQLGLPQYIGTNEVTQLVANLSALYSPELEVGYTAACCSDHQSFHEQGFPATQVFERAGPIADPFYHNSGDLSEREGYDLEQVRSIAKVQFATLLHVAGFELPE